MLVKGPVTVEEVGEFEDEYVYDIGVAGDLNWFLPMTFSSTIAATSVPFRY